MHLIAGSNPLPPFFLPLAHASCPPYTNTSQQLRLEVDSFATADILRVGLMAASRIPLLEPTIEPQQQPPPPPVVERAEPDPEQGLSSVRPGHSAGQVYDPDAALSVAALLAKEMEEELAQEMSVAQKDDGVWMSARAASRTQSPQEVGAKPALKRSLSLTSVASTKLEDHGVGASMMNNRHSLPRNGYAGVSGGSSRGAAANEEAGMIDTKSALRRLYAAIEGRGMVAVKRNPNGKGRSRVMVRSKIKENTIGWAHVLPPFSRKFLPVKELVGASRSSRVVTVYFKGREPVSLFLFYVFVLFHSCLL